MRIRLGQMAGCCRDDVAAYPAGLLGRALAVGIPFLHGQPACLQDCSHPCVGPYRACTAKAAFMQVAAACPLSRSLSCPLHGNLILQHSLVPKGKMKGAWPDYRLMEGLGSRATRACDMHREASYQSGIVQSGSYCSLGLLCLASGAPLQVKPRSYSARASGTHQIDQ